MMKAEDLELLQKIAEYEDQIDWTKPGAELGWSWRDVRIWPSVLNRLLIEGYLDCPFKSNSYTGYRLSEKGWALLRGELTEPEIVETHEFSIPDDLFNIIEGYDEIKELVKSCLRSERPVHILFTGVPSSAKTMFLMELARLGAPYILGSQATKTGIADLLFEVQPHIILVDEIDRLGTRDIAILLSLMETGIISETKFGKKREVKLNTKVFAASNTTNMPRELLSRFLVLFFRGYSEDEFIRVATSVLVKKENAEPALASYIAHRIWQTQKGSADVREAVRIARLAGTQADVDRILGVMAKYSR
jgi:Holliday junction DNA helicase RuvB